MALWNSMMKSALLQPLIVRPRICDDVITVRRLPLLTNCLTSRFVKRQIDDYLEFVPVQAMASRGGKRAIGFNL